VLKTPGISKPHRGDVINFENPSYLSRGPVYTIFQQFCTWSTSRSSISTEILPEKPRVHYLIKRRSRGGRHAPRAQWGSVS
jgi:signal peptidase I